MKIKNLFKEFVLLLKCVPSTLTCFTVLALFSMNLLANKSLSLNLDWLALDGGILVSWIIFFTMDVTTKHFGPRAATMLSVFALAASFFMSAIFYLVSLIPGIWGQAYGDGAELINGAINATFGGTWYVLLGSAAAFIASALINNFSNAAIGRAFKKNPDGIGAFICRSYISTAIGQFTDNIIFALCVSYFFFGWTILQCVTCAITGALAELLCEALFSPLGYRICKKWKEKGVGDEYFAHIRGAIQK